MKKLLTTIFITLLLISLVSSFMPPSHQLIHKEGIQTYQGASTNFYELAIKHPDLVYVGNVLTDISVAYYYVNKGVKYGVTHSPGFCTTMMKKATGGRTTASGHITTLEEEQACGSGSCHHASQDHVSHTIMVPYAIRHTGLINEIIHVFAEQKFDNLVLEKHPEVKQGIISLERESWEKCIPLLKASLEDYDEYESDLREGKTDDLINTFITEVTKSVDPNAGTSYDISFKNKVSLFGTIGLVPAGFLIFYITITLLFGTLAVLLFLRKQKTFINYFSLFLFGALFIILAWLFIALLMGNAFSTLVFIIKPISNLVPIGSYDNHMNNAIQNTYGVLREGESFIASEDNPKIASGFEELKKANQDILYLDYIIIAIVTLTLLFLIYLNFWKKKNKFKYDF